MFFLLLLTRTINGCDVCSPSQALPCSIRAAKTIVNKVVNYVHGLENIREAQLWATLQSKHPNFTVFGEHNYSNFNLFVCPEHGNSFSNDRVCQVFQEPLPDGCNRMATFRRIALCIAARQGISLPKPMLNVPPGGGWVKYEWAHDDPSKDPTVSYRVAYVQPITVNGDRYLAAVAYEYPSRSSSSQDPPCSSAAADQCAYNRTMEILGLHALRVHLSATWSSETNTV